MRSHLILSVSLFITVIIYSQSNNLNTLVGEAHYNKAEYKLALEYLLNAVRNSEDYYELLYHKIGDCYLNLKNYNEALGWYKKEYNKSGKTYAGMLTAFHNIGWDLYNKGNTKKAFKIFEEATKYGFDFPSELKFEKEGWFFITRSNYDNIYYNKSSIKKIEKGKIKVWFKWYWDGQSMNDEDLNKIFYYGNDEAAVTRRIKEIMEERKNVSSSLTYEEYDFNNDRTRLLEVIEYDKNGEVLNIVSFVNDENGKIESSWKNIVPSSVGETIYTTLKNKLKY